MKIIGTILLVIVLYITPACGRVPGEIPSGTWNYALLVNGAPVGSATLSNVKSNGTYIITSELSMNVGSVKNTSRQVITETLEFKPLKIETFNRIVDGMKIQNVDTIATFNGRTVQIQAGSTRTKLTLERDFILDGNFTVARLIAERFKEGTVIRNFIYDPSIEIDTVIPVSTRLLGKETVTVGGKSMRLFHISQSLEGVKSADSFLDENGILVKALIRMLNMKIELIRE